MEEFSFIRIDNWQRAYEKFPFDFILANREWDTDGFFTRFIIFKTLENRDNIPIANLHILPKSLPKGDSFLGLATSYTFIDDIESAKRLLLFLSLKQREEFIKTFNLNFKRLNCETFDVSILGKLSLSDWETKQRRIHSILSFNEDLSESLEVLGFIES